MLTVRFQKGRSDMSAANAGKLLTEIETVTENVLSALTDHRPGDLEPLVVRQCQLMRQLGAFAIQDVDHGRLRLLHDTVVKQQALVAQALRFTDSFLQELSRVRAFDQVG